MKRLYLYLGRRDKKGIKVVKIIPTSSECYATRVPDIKSLHLSEAMTQEISEVVFQNRMDYELWIETADNYRALKQSLIKRGYANLALHEPVMKPEPVIQITNKKIPKASIPATNKPKTMMKKSTSRA